ncbi:MAG: glycosyl hydrolase [Phycisphaerales bacterium]
MTHRSVFVANSTRRILQLCSLLGASAVAASAVAVPPSILTQTPPGQDGPQQAQPQPPGLPVQAPYPIGDWWFSMIFKWSAAPSQVPQGNGCNPLPFCLKPGFNGIVAYLPYPEAVGSTVACGGHTTSVPCGPDTVNCPGFQAVAPPVFAPEVRVSLANASGAETQWPTDPVVKVQGFSTWSVTFDTPKADGTHILRTTAARGSPYLWVEYPDTTDASDFNVPAVEFMDSTDQLFPGQSAQPYQVWHNADQWATSENTQTGSTAGANSPNVAVVSVNGRTYALVGPAGCSWQWKNYTPQPWTSVSFTLQGVTGGAGSRWVVVAALPANTDALVAAGQATRQSIVQLLADHAYFRPDNLGSRTATRLTCASQGCASGNVQGTFSYDALTDIRTGTAAPAKQETLFALFPHQVANLSTQAVLLPTPMTYSSVKGYGRGGKEPRGGYPTVPAPDFSGQMRLAKGRSFTLAYSLPAVPPVVPPMSAFVGDATKLAAYLHEDTTKYNHGDGIDTYNWGKHLSRLANNLAIAKQANADPADTQSFQDQLTAGLSGWFTAKTKSGDPKPVPAHIEDGPGYFIYNATWGTMIGYPAGFGSNTFLNDHHFHYGYFLRASAVLASYDSAWRDTYRPFVELLVRDLAADYGDSAVVDGVQTSFAAYNYFDPYAGHANAAGAQQYANGINQESSSEAVNAWYGMLLWAGVVGDAEMRSRAAFMYCSEADCARRYWFQEDSQVAGVNPVTQRTMGNLFDNVAQYAGFSPGPQYLHIINWLPFGGGAKYLCQNTAYAGLNYEALVSEFGSSNWCFYADLIWMYRAISDPADAQSQFQATIGATVGENFTCDSGNTLAMTYLWIWSNPGSSQFTAITGDLDQDGDVDGADIGALLGAWGDVGSPGGHPADLDCDGMVGGSDLGLLLGNWSVLPPK